MAKQRSRTADYFVYLAVRIGMALFQALPLAVCREIAGVMARIAYWVDKRHRNAALDNLRQSFPGQYSEKQLHHIVRAVYEHFCLMLMEFMAMPRKMRPATWRRYLAFTESKELLAALLSGKPVLIATGHFGNWELASYMLALFGFKSFAVARPLDNPYLDDFFRAIRERTGQKLLAKKGELDRIEQVLEDKHILCSLADQDAGQKGLYVEFFGRPASTHKALALLALHHGAWVVVSGAYRTGDILQYRLKVQDVIPPEAFADHPQAVRALTQRITTSLENLIREDITQYLWLHRRWKHQPKAKQKVMKAAG
jgi:Kdo2-lipid IVA lauroyltransferase/acyltransferase